MLEPQNFLFPLTEHRDARGSITETHNLERMNQQVGVRDWVLDLESFTKSKGTLRGLHFQTGQTTQAKTVRCTRGSVYDVIVDIRQGSPTFGHHLAFILHETEPANLFVPKGFAHGFLTLEDDSIINYKLDARYDPTSATGIFWGDPALSIEWPIDGEPLVSEADAGFANLAESPVYFKYQSGQLDGLPEASI